MFFFKILEDINYKNFFKDANMVSKNYFNVLKYLYNFKNVNLLTLKNVPSYIALNNQKNFFYFLSNLYDKQINVIYLSSFFKRNSLLAYNTLLKFNKLSKVSSSVVMIFENRLSHSLVSKLSNTKLIFVKPLISEKDISLNIYPIFVNLSNFINVYVYSNIIKLFLKNHLNTIFLKKYNESIYKFHIIKKYTK